MKNFGVSGVETLVSVLLNEDKINLLKTENE